MKKTIFRIISCVIALITLIGTMAVGNITVSAAVSGNVVQELQNVTIQNLKTGQYINVDYGVLRNGQPVRVFPFDRSLEQRFSIKKVSNNVYRIVTAASSKYTLDIYRGNAKLKKGQLVDIWKTGADPTAQNIKFYRCSDGSYILCMAENTNLVLAAPDKNGRVKLATFNKSDTAQRWVFKDKNGKKIDITANTFTAPADNKIPVSENTSASVTNWDDKVGQTIANIKSGKSYTKWYGSKNISAKAGFTGECTWYSYGRFYEKTGVALKYANNAKRWLKDNATDKRVKILQGANKVVANSVAVDTSGTYGHVMFIEHVIYDAKSGKPKTIYFSECNWDCNSTYNAGKDCILQKMSYARFIKERSPDGYIVAK